MTILRDLLQAVCWLVLIGMGAFGLLVFAAIAIEALDGRREQMRTVRQAIRTDAKMLNACLHLSVAHFRAANQLSKRGEDL